MALRATRGERALLDLVLATGRTHQARVQLANAGAPIAGDVLYRGSAAPRLMLHAVALELAHPRTNDRLVVRDDLARVEMDAWLERGDLGYGVYDDRAALDRALALAVERRWALGRSADRDPPERKTTAFRLVNEEGDALPGLAVDVYGDHLVAQIYVSDEWEVAGRRERMLDALDALGFDGVYLKLRPRQANVLVDTRRDDLAPRAPVRGSAAPDELVVHEEGAPFAVRLGDGLSTGIFLDQRLNRRAVRQSVRGAAVANLFSYTCAFSVVAALGGAKRTVSVDASLAALERGRAGYALAGASLGREHAFTGRTPSPGSRRPRRRRSGSNSSSSTLRATRRRRSAASSRRATTTSSSRSPPRSSRRVGGSSRAATIAGGRDRSSGASCTRGRAPRAARSCS